MGAYGDPFQSIHVVLLWCVCTSCDWYMYACTVIPNTASGSAHTCAVVLTFTNSVLPLSRVVLDAGKRV